MTGPRFKPVPPPPEDLGTVAAARRAVPLVPGTEADCCARIQSRLELPARDDARAWLTFLRALGLVRETRAGFARVRDDGEPVAGDGPLEEDVLAAAFRERVFGAREVLAALDAADGPASSEAVFERVRGAVPEWERRRDPSGWEDRWRERVRRLLAWAALLGLAERVGSGYRVPEDDA